MLEPLLSSVSLLVSVPLPGRGGMGHVAGGAGGLSMAVAAGELVAAGWAGQGSGAASCAQHVPRPSRPSSCCSASPSHLGQTSLLGSGRRNTGLTSTSTDAEMGGQPPVPSVPPEHTTSHTSLH